MKQRTGSTSPAVKPENLIVAGKITTVHGVKGWVKIHSYSAPEENLFAYQPWWMCFPDGWRQLQVDDFRPVAKGFIAHIRGLDDRDEARQYCQREIQVSTDLFPPVGDDEVYWHQLLGMAVVSHFGGQEYHLGIVDGLLETGANDVIVVKPTAASIDRTERLLPYVDDFIVTVDMDARVLIVTWDPQFEHRQD